MSFVTRLFASLMFFAATSTAGFAADKTVTLKVEGMTCESCPYMVKKAVKKLKGIQKIDVTLATQKAVVSFDDSQTSLEAITKATANAGFPSRLDDGTDAPANTDGKGPAAKPRGSHK